VQRAERCNEDLACDTRLRLDLDDAFASVSFTP
jgi:hypothetical protein